MLDIEREVRRTILLALAEDRSAFDITSKACVSSEQTTTAAIVIKQKSIVAGICFLPVICECIDPSLSCQILAEEGQNCPDGKVLAYIEGNARSILAGERTVLNFLQHICGVADLASQFANAVHGLKCDILDTRKTLPGLRAIQKYAVAIGGGKNHRFHLEERFLIKNNHLKLLKQTTPRPVVEAVRRAKAFLPNAKIEVEVESLEMLSDALEAKADVVMLDNMSASLVAEAVRIVKGDAYLEASGGITLANVREYAEKGVHGISIGALTHSVKAVDISLRI